MLQRLQQAVMENLKVFALLIGVVRATGLRC